MDLSRLRDIAVIAHIDHGKTTLSDRLLELTGAVDLRDMRAQYLDSMELERERGITIKLQSVRLNWRDHVINMIDTPGHVDFGYEVSRSLAACDGVILLVDAAQGIEAQTLANCYLAMENNLEIVAALNKIDLPAAEPDRYAEEIERVLGIPAGEILRISAKTGEGVPELLDAVIERIPPPTGSVDEPLQALIFDSHFDQYRGVISSVRVMNGTLTTGSRLRFMQANSVYDADEIGVRLPINTPVASLGPGEVGYLIAGIKDVGEARSGETVTDAGHPAKEPLPGYREPKPMVFCGLYPIDGDEFSDLREALERLRLNDSSFTYDPESSQALGFGFRCGFLGLLHMEIVRERLEREFDLALISTAPSVEYRVQHHRGRGVGSAQPVRDAGGAGDRQHRRADVHGHPADTHHVHRHADGAVPAAAGRDEEARVPVARACRARVPHPAGRGRDRLLRSAQVAYAGLCELGLRAGGLRASESRACRHPLEQCCRGRVQHDRASAISAYDYGRRMAEKLRELIPRQMFDVPIQAAIGGRIIARETVKAKRKDVLAKCYGGDITRKRKLLERQKEGKKKMKSIGRVEVPQEAFITALRLDD